MGRSILKFGNSIQVNPELRKLKETEKFQKLEKNSKGDILKERTYLFRRFHDNNSSSLPVSEAGPVHFTCFRFNRDIRLKGS